MLAGMYIDLYARADPQSKDQSHMVRTLRFLSAVKRTLTMFMATRQYKDIRTRFLKHLASRNPDYFDFLNDRNRIICDLL